MRLQHGRNPALYRDLLQATIAMPIASGFRNAGRGLGFAHLSIATCATGTAVSVGHSGDYQGVEKHQGCSNDK
jgi:hypothetical protein